MLINLANTIIVQTIEPKNSLFARRIDTFNEFFFAMVSTGLLLFTDFVGVIELRYKIGWFIVGLI